MIFQTVAAHSFFKQARLGVSAVEDGGARGISALGGFAEILGDVVGREEGFVLAVGGFVVSDLGAALARRPEVLAFAANVVGDHRRGGLQNVLRGAVVLLEADGFRLGKILFEFENVADVSAAPRVNRLVFVTDGADIVAVPGEHSHELVLRPVGVLVLVDQEILEAAVVVFAHGRGRLQQAGRFEQQVVEVEGIGLAEFFAILLE